MLEDSRLILRVEGQFQGWEIALLVEQEVVLQRHEVRRGGGRRSRACGTQAFKLGPGDIYRVSARSSPRR